MQTQLILAAVRHKVTLIYDEQAVCVINSTPQLEECLFFTETVFEDNEDEDGVKRRPMKTKRERVAMFFVKSLAPRAIQTHQGFLNRLKKRAEELGYEVSLYDDRMPFPPPMLERMHGFRGSQGRLTIQLLLAFFAGCLQAPTRFGKCLGPDTEVMTINGVVLAKNLQPGDVVVQPGGKLARVLRMTTGKEPMIRVRYLDMLGDDWLCTYDHPLCVLYRGEKRIMKAGDVMRLMDTQSDFSREVRMQHHCGFENVDWVLGQNEIEDWSRFRTIPFGVFRSSRFHARQIFDALLEKNGWSADEGIKGPISWLRDLKRLLRAAGARASIVTGRLRWKWGQWELTGTPFTLDPAGTGPFFGPEIGHQDGSTMTDEERVFLLGDGTVTHNTTIIVNICRAFPSLPTVIALPGVDLVKQLADDVKAQMPERRVAVLATGSKNRLPSDDITVASIDSLHKCDPGTTRLLLVDEPHAAVTDPRIEDIMKFEKARRYAIGATLGMRFDRRDPLIEGLFGPVHAKITFLEAVAEKSICPIVALIPVIKIPARPLIKNRDRAYDFHLFLSERMGNVFRELILSTIPPEWQTLVFIKNEKQAEFFAKYLPEGDPFIAMAKRMSGKKERDEIFEKMRSGTIKRCLSSSIYAQGVTFPDLRVVVNLAGGGPYQSSVQKPGRLAQNRPGKRCGVLIDFLFVPDLDESPSGVNARENFERENMSSCLCRESMKRIECYKATGYDIVYVNNLREFKTAFNEKCL